MIDSGDTADGLPWANEPAETSPTAEELERAGQASMFGEAQPAPEPAPDPAPPSDLAKPDPNAAPAKPVPEPAGQPYRVLARKYRPQTFAELIGQEAMVRTLANAIARDRLAHAFLMTGVRGVGKTSTARLIAKALNCVGPDGQGGPTINPCGVCEPCRAIAEGRHIDVLEMDAASNTQVEKMRDLLDGVMYAAVTARYKIYIIDEVHMLSTSSFNAMLKTLEEPPAHVKFIFATTEVNKVPITVLSRTQRFDLKRIPADMLQNHFAEISRKEGIPAEDEALRIIAGAAEGSVRDGLSILDQAIAHADLDGEGKVTAARVRDMLGLADKGAQRRLLGHLLGGDAKAMLAAVDEQYALGVEPIALLRALMDLTHRIALAQVAGGEPEGVTAEERAELAGWLEKLSAGQVHRLWQLLLKGHEEVRQAPDPLIAARMALLRVLHAADLPDPEKLARKLEALATLGPAAGPQTSGDAAPDAAQSARLDWAELVARIEPNRPLTASVMGLQVRPVSFEDGVLTFARAAQFTDDIIPTLRDALSEATGKRWQVEEVSGVPGEPTLVEREHAARAAADAATRAHPLVEAAFAVFPDAQLVTETDTGSRQSAPWSRQA